ncbi:MAG: restriction endonuclease subunit S [Planctomycetes bacterium]|nr:restriction endonuclease subunit S [Planctomycetota bacterium]
MNKGWVEKRLDAVAEFSQGIQVGLGDQSNAPAKGLVRFIRIIDYTQGTDDIRYVQDPGLRYWADKSDIVMVRYGTPGLVGRGIEGVIANNLFKISILDGSLTKDFLAYFLSQQTVQTFLSSQGSSTMPALTFTQLGAVVVPVPPLAEQQRIVGLLDEAFEGLATAKANAEKNLQNARALFESHLQSVFTQRGPGWKQKTLEEIATTFGRGKSKHRPRNEPKLYGGKYPFIQTGDIRNADHFITGYSQTYSELGLAQSKLWPKGTICITIAANIAETAILGFDACFPDSVIGVVANPKEAEVGFIEYLLQSFKARIQALGKGSAQANINMGTFENERFPFPPVAEQKEIVAKFDALTEKTQRLARLYEQKLAALEALKKSLLHQAFTGEL